MDEDRFQSRIYRDTAYAVRGCELLSVDQIVHSIEYNTISANPNEPQLAK